MASGTHGLPRQTNDIDILADLPAALAEDFCAALGPAFYADPESARKAVEAGRAFNVIHIAGAYKFAIFPAGDDRFARSELARRRYTRTAITSLEHIEFPVATAEDAILSKLVWYRKGGEVSERQWHDIAGVLRVQPGRLDEDYLRTWAAQLGVGDLLARALP